MRTHIHTLMSAYKQAYTDAHTRAHAHTHTHTHTHTMYTHNVRSLSSEVAHFFSSSLRHLADVVIRSILLAMEMEETVPDRR